VLIVELTVNGSLVLCLSFRVSSIAFFEIEVLCVDGLPSQQQLLTGLSGQQQHVNTILRKRGLRYPQPLERTALWQHREERIVASKCLGSIWGKKLCVQSAKSVTYIRSKGL